LSSVGREVMLAAAHVGRAGLRALEMCRASGAVTCPVTAHLQAKPMVHRPCVVQGAFL
jgi:hypothetical protein